MSSRGLAYHDVGYWETRFGSDPRESAAAGGFEWLSTGSELLTRTEALILASNRQLNILHIGVGTSSLSLQIAFFQREMYAQHWEARCARIVNVDFSATSTAFQQQAERQAFESSEPDPFLMQYRTLDLLDRASLCSQLGPLVAANGKFDLILDKSTTDSISTAPDVDLGTAGSLGKILGPTTQLLALNLASIASEDCIWLCHSYSSNRWQDLTLSPHLDLFPWEQISKVPVELAQDQVNAPTLYHYVYEMRMRQSK